MHLTPTAIRIRKGTVVSLIALLTLGAVPLTQSNAPARAARDTRPNILLIYTDDQRWDEGTMAVMPKTRAIGRRGLRFEQAYIADPLCCPSRATIMTGRYSHNTGVHDNDGGFQLDQSTTVQARLEQAEYNTSIFGKFLNGRSWTSPSYFDRWLTLCGRETVGPTCDRRGRDYRKPRLNDQGVVRRFSGYVTDVLKKHAVAHLKSLESRDQTPWFMILAPNAPHLPSTPARRHEDAPIPEWGPSPAVLEDDVTDKPAWVEARSPADIDRMDRIRAKQLRALMAVDEMIGRVDEVLRNLRERANTLVIFLSDNGFSYGEHWMWGALWKRHPYTSAIKTPLYVRWPKVIEPRVTKRLVTNVDVAPTIYDAAGVDPPVEVDGRSLLSFRQQRRYVYLEHFEHGDSPPVPTWRSVRYEDHQYTEYYHPVDVPLEREYYDLENDPWQLVNLLDDGDPLNDPDTIGDAMLLERLSTCHGTTGSNACP